jgi:hypothetical protein
MCFERAARTNGSCQIREEETRETASVSLNVDEKKLVSNESGDLWPSQQEANSLKAWLLTRALPAYSEKGKKDVKMKVYP